MITSLFASMNHAVRSMQNAQFALNVHGTNIAHANDPNYTRRDVLSPSEAGLFGPGIFRYRDEFIDSQYRAASGGLGQAEVRKNLLSKVETIFGDPVEGGLRKSIDQLFDSWHGLAENPADGVARLQVLSAGRNFSQQIKSTYQQLSDVEQNINEDLAVRVDEVNTGLHQIQDLNRRIAELQRNGMGDADLRDQRDVTLDKLAKLMGGSAAVQPDGSYRVVVGTTVIVDGPRVVELSLQAGPGGPVPVWKGAEDIPFGGQGTIAGLVSVRDDEVTSLKADIDALGKTVANELNAKHRLGKGLDGVAGRDFFECVGRAGRHHCQPEPVPGSAGSGRPGRDRRSFGRRERPGDHRPGRDTAVGLSHHPRPDAVAPRVLPQPCRLGRHPGEGQPGPN